MRNRILTFVNLLLVLVCGGCIWYLVSYEPEPHPELDEAKALVNNSTTPTPTPAVQKAETYFNPLTHKIETRYIAEAVATATPTPTPTPTPEPPSNLSKTITGAIWTPTPSPTPSPTPTPAPPDLGTAVQIWKIMSMDADVVEFLDPRGSNGQGETFQLKVGGPPRQSADKDNRMVDVSLISVDMDNGVVVLGYQGQTYKKSMMEGQ